MKKDHWPEYLCEFIGTAAMIFVGLSAVALNFGAGAPGAAWIANPKLRLFLTACIFSSGGTAVAYSYLGKRSGAHINPAVTLMFFLMKKIRSADALSYIVMQVSGAILGAFLVAKAWGPWAASVRLGVTVPATGVGTAGAFAVETGMTFLLALLILAMVNVSSLARFTGLAAGLLVVVLVFFGAPVTGASLNPARSLGPAVVLHFFDDILIYITAPLLGAVLAVLLYRVVTAPGRRGMCGKIFHATDVRCIFCGLLPGR